MEDIKGINVKTHEYLAKVDPRTWCRGWFNTNAKCDLLHNNLSECFNSWITKFRDKTILIVLEGIRGSLMRMYCKGRRFVVNLLSKTCWCRKWDVTSIPCGHVISSLWLGGGNPEDYLSPYFRKEMYLKAYTPIIYPVPSEEQWVRIDQPQIEPPKSRATIGRPKKVRNRGQEETSNPYTVRRGVNKNQCGKCKKYGHNTRTCTLRKRHDEIQERRRSFYKEHAGNTDCNLDRVSCSFGCILL
jgi:hypothetical protein